MAGPQPVIPAGYDIYIDTFFRLNSERKNGEGVIGSIPALSILTYAEWLDIENINEFIDIISRIDVVYVNAVSEQMKRQIQQASKGT